jgi:hypothetical protein
MNEDHSTEMNEDHSTEMYRRLIRRYYEEFLDLESRWRDLERKAQVPIGICGILLGGAFALLAQPNINIPVLPKICLALTSLSLSSAVFRALTVLKIVTVPGPPTGNNVENWIMEIEKNQTNTCSTQKYKELIKKEAEFWRESNEKHHEEAQRKASAVHQAQVLVSIGLFFITIATLYLLVNK